jgi:aldehyde dehydrogenase (NAD+)
MSQEEQVVPTTNEEQITSPPTESNEDNVEKQYNDIIKSLRSNVTNGLTRPFAYRQKQLQQLRSMLVENKEALFKAQIEDLRQSDLVQRSEIYGPLDEINYLLEHLETWMKPVDVQPKSVMNAPSRAKLVHEPQGVVLLISPWNYPISLVVKPLAGALSAGCTCIVKPSELAPTVSNLLAELIPKYLDKRSVHVILGGIPETTTLLTKCRFDHIFYTGSTPVGKIVMRAAAENLTPVSLELGGKSPCYIDKDLSLELTVKRLVWAKWLNNGQTCVAPDYILLHRDVKDKFIETLKNEIKIQYGEDAQKSKDYSRIINQRHAQRVAKLIEPYHNTEKLVYGGRVDIDDKYVEPTVILDPSWEDPIMADEIFGPVMPIIQVDGPDHAIQMISKTEKPLALYVFSTNTGLTERFTNETSSGAIMVNDCIGHFVESVLPFGGVGHSGMGCYNGKYSFDTFSHVKTVMSKASWVDPSIRYTPRTESELGQLDTLFQGKLNFATPLINFANYFMSNK